MSAIDPFCENVPIYINSSQYSADVVAGKVLSIDIKEKHGYKLGLNYP